MFNEFNTLHNWLDSAADFSQQSSEPVLLQTYQEWLNEHFNYSNSVSGEIRSMSL